MLQISDLQTGSYIIHNGAPHQVIYTEHSKIGRGGAMLRAKLKNLISGSTIDFTFKGNDKVEQANISRSKAQFTYAQGNQYHFMDSANFEQFTLTADTIGAPKDFLKEGVQVDVINFDGKPINISLPIKLDLLVKETEPAVRGNTAQGSVTKPAILETGAKIQVPIFIKVGDKIKVNTQTGEYVSRIN